MNTSGLYANRNDQRDFFKNALLASADSGCNVYIAVAFFTETSVIDELLDSGCIIRLIVRLGFPTNPTALERFMGNPRVQIRYFTGHSFHPKLYIFGDDVAFVGSANLTGAAILTNQEVVVSIDHRDDRFSDLAYIFSGYWSEARVLHDEDLKKYKNLYSQFQQHLAAAEKLGQQILNQLGDSAPSNITREKTKQSNQAIYIEEFRKTYQESLAAFAIVRKAYEDSGYRKVDEALIPLRLEIDSFISFVRERKAQGDSWEKAPIRSAADQVAFISDLIPEWRATPWKHFEQTIVPENYPRLMKVFHSPESLRAITPDHMFDALCTLHSFHDRFRFFEGGMPTWKSTFLAANDHAKVIESLAYLVFGKDGIEHRMANLIFNPEYKLSEFGRANVQELVGWCNREQLPVINGRTTKVLRFFGSQVAQL